MAHLTCLCLNDKPYVSSQLVRASGNACCTCNMSIFEPALEHATLLLCKRLPQGQGTPKKHIGQQPENSKKTEANETARFSQHLLACSKRSKVCRPHLLCFLPGPHRSSFLKYLTDINRQESHQATKRVRNIANAIATVLHNTNKEEVNLDTDSRSCTGHHSDNT